MSDTESACAAKSEPASCYAVRDMWHLSLDGAEEVRSTDPAFRSTADFFTWVKQHGGTMDEIYLLTA